MPGTLREGRTGAACCERRHLLLSESASSWSQSWNLAQPRPAMELGTSHCVALLVPCREALPDLEEVSAGKVRALLPLLLLLFLSVPPVYVSHPSLLRLLLLLPPSLAPSPPPALPFTLVLTFPAAATSASCSARTCGAPSAGICRARLGARGRDRRAGRRTGGLRTARPRS
eukprot:751885-Hanusia_phi.AAC.1